MKIMRIRSMARRGGLNSEQLNGKIHETFALVRNSVEAELHGATPAVAPIAGMPVASTCTKAKTPTVNNYYTLRTDDELNRFVSLANSIEKSVNSGSFYPNETGFGCGECPYADRCKKWR